MTNLAEALNKELAEYEATLALSNGESLRIKGDTTSISDQFISVSLSNNPDKKGRKLININHIVSIDWYTR
ncbi:MAG TPA: hypothetical protein PLH03_06245 [Methylophilaceae bacterium]|nr:hypothetical protein [Methylophilaceae bacterium]